MERCTLCGGRLVNGRCTECGLDNTKNDRKYHLNTHNEKSAALFHRGDCEDHLNKDNGYGDNWPWKRKKQPVTAGLESYQRKGAAAGTYAGASSGTDVAAAASARASAVSTVPQTSSTATRVPQSTAAGKSSAARRRELKQRSQTGTVRKKSGAGRLIKLLFLILILLFVVFPIVAQKLTEYKRSGGTIFNFNIGGSGSPDNGPEPIAWDEDDERYYGIRLEPGVYEVGYDLPAGEYQLCCSGLSADVYWQDADADKYDYKDLTLYAPERQVSYRDFWDEDCPYHQYSDRIALSDGMLFVVETGLDTEGVELEGLEDPGAVRKEREPQPGLEAVQVEEGLTAGEDFPVGVYNLMLDDADDEYAYGSVSVQIDRTGKTIDAGADSDHPVFWHIPFTGGEKIRIMYQNDNGGAHLVPSF